MRHFLDQPTSIGTLNAHGFQATDVFAAFLFYLEGNAVASGLTLAFVFAPGIFIFTTEAAKVGRQITYETRFFFQYVSS